MKKILTLFVTGFLSVLVAGGFLMPDEAFKPYAKTNEKMQVVAGIEIGKDIYLYKEKLHIELKNSDGISIKEIQVRPRTEQHDLDTKLKHAKRFLLEGDKVKINLRFMGREMAHQDIGFKLLEKLTKDLEEISILETPPKKEGRQLFVLIAPDPAKIKDYLKLQKKNEGKKKEEAKVEEVVSKEETAEA